MFKLLVLAAGIASSVRAHEGHEHQEPIEGPHQSLWFNRLPGDGGTQVCHARMGPQVFNG